MIILSVFFSFLVLTTPLKAAAPETSESSAGPVLPNYISLSPNIHDFTKFADGGDDSNWYVGFNNSWIVKLPPAPLGEYAHAFIGAKIGRAKSRPLPNKPWMRELIDGKIYMAISQQPSWTSEQSFFLAETEELPREPDAQAHIDNVGASEWFWAEVPLAMVSLSKPNYLIIWSPTSFFVRSSSSPILAAAALEEKTAEPVAWNNHSISGVPPRNPGVSLETPLNNISPALAIKLVPPSSDEVSVSEFSSTAAGHKHVVGFSVGGENIMEAWVESSRDQLDWQLLSRMQKHPPFLFTLGPDRYPPPGAYLRGAARDLVGNIGYSEPFIVPYAP